MFKNNARGLISHILSIVNSDWLHHVPSVRGVYESSLLSFSFVGNQIKTQYFMYVLPVGYSKSEKLNSALSHVIKLHSK